MKQNHSIEEIAKQLMAARSVILFRAVQSVALRGKRGSHPYRG